MGSRVIIKAVWGLADTIFCGLEAKIGNSRFFNLFIVGSPEGGGVLDNIRGNTGGICAPNALVASRKLLPVLIEVVGVTFPFIVLM